MTPDELSAVCAAIDAENASDPNLVDWRGESVPKEILHAERATYWLSRRDPDASPAQRIAARAHHLRRWTRPRADYPDGRRGYLKWRADAKVAQAAELATLLAEHSVDEAIAQHAAALVAKERGADAAGVADAAVHEDVLCLVFFEQQAVAVAEQLGATASERVVSRTLAKMTAEGRALLGEINMPDALRSMIDHADA